MSSLSALLTGSLTGGSTGTSARVKPSKRKILADDVENKKKPTTFDPATSWSLVTTNPTNISIQNDAIDVPRPTMERLRFYHREFRRVPTLDKDLLGDFMHNYKRLDPASKIHNYNEFQLHCKDVMTAGKQVDRFALNVSQDTENLGNLEGLAQHTRKEFVRGLTFYRKTTALGTLPIADQVSIMQSFQRCHYIWMLSMLSLDLDQNLIRLDFNNRSFFDLNIICTTRHELLRNTLISVVDEIVKPFRSYEIDRYEMSLLSRLLFWLAASDAVAYDSPSWCLAREMEQKLLAHLEEYEYEQTDIPGRLGSLLMLMRTVQRFCDCVASSEFSEYKKLHIISLPEDLIECFVTTL